MNSFTEYLWFETRARHELVNITNQIESVVEKAEIKEGMCLVSAMHISASVFVNDHEPGLWADILEWLETRIAPWDPEVYRHNIGTGEDVTIRELAETVARVLGFDGKLVFDATKPDGTPRKLMDISRLHGLGWRHTIGLEQGIERTWEAVRNRLTALSVPQK